MHRGRLQALPRVALPAQKLCILWVLPSDRDVSQSSYAPLPPTFGRLLQREKRRDHGVRSQNVHGERPDAGTKPGTFRSSDQRPPQLSHTGSQAVVANSRLNPTVYDCGRRIEFADPSWRTDFAMTAGILAIHTGPNPASQGECKTKRSAVTLRELTCCTAIRFFWPAG